MENFFKWMTTTMQKEEVNNWFSANNIKYEKILLFEDIFKSLNHIINDTYLGYDDVETKISMSENDNLLHFEWCWYKLVKDFNSEKIKINEDGPHREYFKNFFITTFYSKTERELKSAIPKFLDEIFDTEKEFTKSDLDVLTEIYKLLDKNVN
jgi:hypothetical protein